MGLLKSVQKFMKTKTLTQRIDASEYYIYNPIHLITMCGRQEVPGEFVLAGSSDLNYTDIGKRCCQRTCLHGEKPIDHSDASASEGHGCGKKNLSCRQVK